MLIDYEKVKTKDLKPLLYIVFNKLLGAPPANKVLDIPEKLAQEFDLTHLKAEE